MNIDKRYCQNRQRKRKRTIVQSTIDENVSPSEEERQFKLKRFAEDVEKFLSEKEKDSNQKDSRETKMKYFQQAHRAVNKVNIPKQMVHKGVFHGGMKTKICKRGGAMTREMTAKLDEDLYQIISLAKNSQSDNKCQCNQRKSHFGSPELGVHSGNTPASVLKPLQPRSSPRDSYHFQSPQVDPGGSATGTSSSDKCGKSLADLDKELYPLFARVVSISCTQTKSALFKNQSYVSAVKRKLVDIYVDRMKEDSQKTTSSVGTSPLPSSVTTQSPQKRTEQPFELAPAKVHFKSNMQFFEETIGPSSTCSSNLKTSSPSCSQPNMQCRQPNLECSQTHPSLLSPPEVRYRRPQKASTYVPRSRSYIHEPFMMSPSPTSTLLDILHKSNMFDGSGDGSHLNTYSSFLPPIEEEEDSPDFRYFPTKIF